MKVAIGPIDRGRPGLLGFLDRAMGIHHPGIFKPNSIIVGRSAKAIFITIREVIFSPCFFNRREQLP